MTLTAADLCSLPVVSGCALSPSAKLVAFVVTTIDEASNGYKGSIKVLDLESGQSTVCTTAIARDGVPQWSADGQHLFFISDRGGSMQLWRYELGSSEPTALPHVPGNASEFALSPDGKHIAVITTPTTKREEVEQRGWRRITRLRYRADGPGFFDDLPQLWLIDIAAFSARALTNGDGFVGAPAWDAQGRRLAFTGEHDPRADSLWRTELWTADAAQDFQPHQVAKFGSMLDAPVWSGDGSRLAFFGIEEARASGGLRNIGLFTIDRNGNAARRVDAGVQWTGGNFVLTDVSVAGGIPAPVWAASQELAFVATQRGAAQVMRIRDDGSDARALTPPFVSVSSFSLVDPETVLFCASEPATPPELYRARGDDVKRLTHETATWCEQAGVSKAQAFSVESEGNQIDAWHLAGSGQQPRACVLQIHGGPHFAYGNAFVFEFLLLAAAGYDVVYCNPRGSQSYGEAFAGAIKGNWAQPAFDDCMRVLDEAIKRFPINAQRLGVAGGSYGGYLTGWTIGNTKRFTAAIAMRPASNLASLWGTSEVGRMLAEDFGGRPFQVPHVYQRDSVLPYADAITTPLLIIHSENDYRTPTEQSEQLFTALCERGATVEVLRFLKTDHNLSRTGSPRQRVARLEAIIEWFDRFLKK